MTLDKSLRVSRPPFSYYRMGSQPEHYLIELLKNQNSNKDISLTAVPDRQGIPRVLVSRE